MTDTNYMQILPNTLTGRGSATAFIIGKEEMLPHYKCVDLKGNECEGYQKERDPREWPH